MKFKTHWYRWEILLIAFTAASVSDMLNRTLTAYGTTIAAGYDISVAQVEAVSIIGLAVFFPGNLFAMKLLTTVQLATAMRIGAFLLLVGGWIRIFVQPG